MAGNTTLRRPALALALLSSLLLGACGGGGGGNGGDTPPAPAAGEQALAVSQPGELVAYVQGRLRARETAPPGPPVNSAGDGAVSPAAAGNTTRSETTLLEAGVDEPDLLKSDGQALYALQLLGKGSRLSVYTRAGDGRALPASRIDVPVDSSIAFGNAGLVLAADGRSLALVSQQWEPSTGGPCSGPCFPTEPAADSAFLPLRSATVQRVDVSQPAASRLGERVVIEGTLVDSRRVGDTLYVVTRHEPVVPLDKLPAGASAAEREAAIRATSAADLLPWVRRNGGPQQPLLADTDCFLQPKNASVDLQITTVTAFDLKSPDLPSRSRCFVGGSEALYMTTTSLYLATTRWQVSWLNGSAIYPAEIRTDIHKFALGAGALVYRGSGDVQGHLGWDLQLKPYRLSELAGDLRVLTYTGAGGSGAPIDAVVASASVAAPSPALLTVLRERPADLTLQPLATLPNSRHPEPLGKPGEQVKAVRFIGPRAYVVTFRTVDPLYVLDLSDPADPRTVGVLEVPGYSDQLFPLSDGLLLGVGRQATGFFDRGGIKLGLFDVRDLTRPRELQSVTLGGAGSTSALDSSRHGLNWRVQDGVARLALPVDLATDVTTVRLHGLQRLEVDTRVPNLTRLSMAGSVVGPGYAAVDGERSLQIGNQLYYLRDGEIGTYDW